MTTPLQKAAQDMLKSITDDEWIEAYEELRKALDAELQYVPEISFGNIVEPVAWAMFRADGLVLDVICPDEHESYEGFYTKPLYLHPPHPQATTPVPEGYVLVPIEPTKEMIDSTWHDKFIGMSDDARNARIRIYKAMIAAAQGEKP